MNHLAHFHLAGDSEALIVGALLGDFVKGPLRGEWPEAWEAGIRLHRRTDALTDQHPEVIALLETLPGEFRRFGGIMLDVCFDHCLTRHWSRFHDQPLEDFARRTYTALNAASEDLPPPARRLAGRLARYDILCGMCEWEMVDGMLTRIGQRLSRDNPLHEAAGVLSEHYERIEQGFLALYPELQQILEREKKRALASDRHLP